jgi:hypothetical protein
MARADTADTRCEGDRIRSGGYSESYVTAATGDAISELPLQQLSASPCRVATQGLNDLEEQLYASVRLVFRGRSFTVVYSLDLYHGPVSGHDNDGH